jgi:RNA recognition motif-containing protein
MIFGIYFFVAGVSTSYGFVDYFKAEDAECALKLLNGLILESKMLKVFYEL